MRALRSEKASRSSFSPRLGTVKVTPSKSIVADGRKGTITSRAQFAAGDLFDDMLNGQRQHLRAVGIDARREPHGRDGRDRTVADAQEVAVGGIVVLDEREDVDVDDAGR